MEKNFSIGIDLGTSNSAVAISRIDEKEIKILPITQVSAPDAIAEKELLASAIYIPAAGEFSSHSLNPPWCSPSEKRNYAVGAFAREHGALVPERVISSAKSWLCNAQVDRRADILPWKSEMTEAKLSPVEVSSRILAHLKSNLEYHADSIAELLLQASQVVLTVPASFDEVARNLSYEAAHAAGWENITLLEEPQAAFYAWIASHEQEWRSQIKAGDIVLVCDVGGGTTDFSLIAVSEKGGDLQLNRISVGDHILLGGDNMDLALAYAVHAKLEAEGKALSRWEFLSLVHLSRQAKEKIFADPSLAEIPISIVGRGSSLFADTLSVSIDRKQIESLILDGFFPQLDSPEMPQERRSAALREFGLPYAADPGITRYMARFLRDSLRNVKSDPALAALLGTRENSEQTQLLLPNKVLFNGGVFKAQVLRQRVIEVLQAWSAEQGIVELQGSDLDLAVARGACAYGKLALSGKGLRIKAGTARSYYVGLESSMPAVPGLSPPVKGLCVLPQGTEEGTRLKLGGTEFGLLTGQPADFRFFSSTTRAGDTLGTVVEDAVRELEETSHLEVSLPAAADNAAEVVPVELEAVVTEIGTLELWMLHTKSDNRWKLDFNLRANS